jgi:drug/metabolite transporter (DMT)-like permease
MAPSTGSTRAQGPARSQDGGNPGLGTAAATGIVFIWSSWLIVTKVGAESTLTIFDIAALRFGLSALISLPFVLYYKPWRGMPLHRVAAMSLLAGLPYVLVTYAAFTFAPAAYGGVFINGVMPAMTLAIGWLWLKEQPRSSQLAGAALIIAGASLAAIDARSAAASGAWIGALLFLAGALMFSTYMVLNRIWQVTAPQILFTISVVTAVYYLPLWYLFLPSNMAATETSQILLQAVFQMLPNLVGFNLLAIAVRNVGAAPTAAILSAVPGLGAILGLIILDEELGAATWIGIAVLSLGILLTALRPRRSRSRHPSLPVDP